MVKKNSIPFILISSICFYVILIVISSFNFSEKFYIKYGLSIFLFIHILLLYIITFPSFKYIYHYYLVNGIINIYFFRNIFFGSNKTEFIYFMVYYVIYLISISSKRILFNYRDSITLHQVVSRLEPLIRKRFDLEEKVHPLKQRNQDLEEQKMSKDWIYNQTKKINATLEFDEMVNLIKKTLMGVKGISNFVFYIKKDEEGNYKQLFDYNLNDDMKRYVEFFLKEKEKKFFDKVSSYVKFEIETEEMNHNLINLNIFPFVLKDEIIGVLLQFEDKDQRNTVAIIENIKIVSRYIAMGIKKSLLYNKVQQLSRKDGLTSLYLRRVFDQFSRQEFVRCKRYKSKLSLIMMDIDFFKKLNDKYGHLFGDKVLTDIAKIIMDNIKVPLTASRYGGEEFVIICPNINKKEACELAEKIRMGVKKYSFKHNNKIIHTTISGGVAEFNNRMKDESVLLKKADDNLYKAKKAGRDQIKK